MPDRPPNSRLLKTRQTRPRAPSRTYGHDHRDMRGKVLGRNKGVCERCQAAPAVHAHHRVYPAKSAADYISLCQPCHVAIHRDAD